MTNLSKYISIIQILLSVELLSIWATLSYGALAYPATSINYDICLSGGGTDLRLLFGKRLGAYIFLNVEAFLSPIIIPLSGLLLI